MSVKVAIHLNSAPKVRRVRPGDFLSAVFTFEPPEADLFPDTEQGHLDLCEAAVSLLNANREELTDVERAAVAGYYLRPPRLGDVIEIRRLHEHYHFAVDADGFSRVDG